jgi:hypothetical protein
MEIHDPQGGSVNLATRVSSGMRNFFSALNQGMSSSATKASSLVSEQTERQRGSFLPILSNITDVADAVSNILAIPAAFSPRGSQMHEIFRKVDKAASAGYDAQMALEEENLSLPTMEGIQSDIERKRLSGYFDEPELPRKKNKKKKKSGPQRTRVKRGAGVRKARVRN